MDIWRMIATGLMVVCTACGTEENSALKVVDAAGHEVGEILALIGNSALLSTTAPLRLFQINMQSGELAACPAVEFTQPDCRGTAYARLEAGHFAAPAQTVCAGPLDSILQPESEIRSVRFASYLSSEREDGRKCKSYRTNVLALGQAYRELPRGSDGGIVLKYPAPLLIAE